MVPSASPASCLLPPPALTFDPSNYHTPTPDPSQCCCGSYELVRYASSTNCRNCGVAVIEKDSHFIFVSSVYLL
jgi:hypothetical protein